MRHCMLAILFALAAMSVTPGHAQQPIVLKLSHVVSDQTAKGKAALRFKELAEQMTAGRVKVEVFANSALYKDKEEIEALQLGSVQMLIPAVAKFAPMGLTDFDVFDLPYMFDGIKSLHAVTEGPIGQSMLAKLNKVGVKGLTFWDNSFVMFSSSRPLIQPRDIQGLKMRSYSKVIDAQYRALGALPQSMAFSELYQGLQTGVIDGQDTVPVNMKTQKLYEVQKYGVLTYHRHPVYAVIVNTKWWDALPSDIRTSLEMAMIEATKFNNAIAAQENADAITAMKASGRIELHEPTPDELKAWRAALVPVYKAAEQRVSSELIKAVQKDAGTGR